VRVSLRRLIVMAFSLGCVLEFLCHFRIGVRVDIGSGFLIVWGLSPYLVLFGAPRLCKSRAEVVAVIIATVVSDAVLRLGFLLDKSSMAVLDLAGIPFCVLILFMPIGSLGTRLWIWVRSRKTHGVAGA
jgi:chromate transport protein ChrA